MAGADPLPPPSRASDADRDRVVRVLRDSAVAGRLTHESFVRRLDVALRAKDHQALEDLLVDLPGDRALALHRLTRTTARLTATTMQRVGRISRISGVSRVSHWNGTGVPALRFPADRDAVFVIGRDPDCDLVLSDPTVSRRHAVLRHFGSDWFIDDLGSTNGTRVNGWRLRAGAAVRAGDRVAFGRASFRLAGD